MDAGSTDFTVNRARGLTAEDPRFRIIEAGPATPGRARNVGIAAAQGNWIALTDAGIRLEATWLASLQDAVRRTPDAQVVYGNYEPVLNSFFERSAALAYLPAKHNTIAGPVRGPSIASALLQRAVWKAVGGFPDLRAAEDLIFMEQIEQGGFKVVWAPTATVHWHLQPGLRKTFRRFALYSKHNVWAGRQRLWHHGTARMYVGALPFIVLAAAHTPAWLLIPFFAAMIRVGKSLWQRRDPQRPRLRLLDPLQFVAVGVILATIDLATFVGWIQALLQRPPSDAPVVAHQKFHRI